jgi:hypothetical protein
LAGVKSFAVSKRKKNTKNMMYPRCAFAARGSVITVIATEREQLHSMSIDWHSRFSTLRPFSLAHAGDDAFALSDSVSHTLHVVVACV